MEIRCLVREKPAAPVEAADVTTGRLVDCDWMWVDVEVTIDEDPVAAISELQSLLSPLGLDALAISDAVTDSDLPKFDDFGDHILLVLHGLRDDAVATYEVDCFLTSRVLVTVHQTRSPSIEALWSRCLESPSLAAGGPDELLARLSDVLSRRLLSVVDAFDYRIDDLIEAALKAEPHLVETLTAVRADITATRRIVRPQREALAEIRRFDSPSITPAGKRRFDDVYDITTRTAHGLDAARTALSETLDAYRGAEARKATEVSRVLTIYAAIMLPLTLIVGFFGMNFAELPLVDRSNGWILVSLAMAVVAALSLGVFVGAGWMRRPSGRSAGRALGRGLIEAAMAPVELVGTVLEVPGEAARSASERLLRRRRQDRQE